jgi:hypothetical protein
MMWRKALLFNDAEMAQAILNEPDGAKVQILGRRVRGFKKSEWDAVAKACVRDGVLLKFAQNDDIKRALLATAGRGVAEGRHLGHWIDSRRRRAHSARTVGHQLAWPSPHGSAQRFAQTMKGGSLFQASHLSSHKR